MFKKVISFVTSSAIAAAFITFVPVNEGKRSNNAYAKTIAEMQEEIKSNKETISELQNQLDALAGNKAEEQQYQSVLNEQISVISADSDLL